ncbi:VOC family protein [Streptomyces sp. NPDC048389]|uniref:VOC family protein n=1 Tax=Streptomyces sp. NPDC048389 TaxID=3154622 RepID=UPI003456FE82
MTGEISFFGLGVADAGQARTFHRGLFGWTFDAGTTEGGGYSIRTPNIPGGDAGPSPCLFFKVDDMRAAVARVRELGGSVDDADVGGDEETVARFGRFRLCHDDQGSPFGFHQPPS